MNNVDGVGYVQKGGKDPFAGKPASYKGLARLMTRMWSSFIYGLDPNNSGGMFELSPKVVEVMAGADENSFSDELGVACLWNC